MKFSITVTGVLTAVIFFLVTTIFDLDLFEEFTIILAKLDKYEIDELIIPILIILVSMLFDYKSRAEKTRTENEKMKIYKAMVFSVQHILNNFLHQMQLFKITAEDTPDFPENVLNLFDSTIEEASGQINALSTISQIDEDTIYESVKP